MHITCLGHFILDLMPWLLVQIIKSLIMQFPLASCYCFHVKILSTAALPHTMYYEHDGSQQTWKLPINFSFYILHRLKSTPKPTWRKHLFCAVHWCRQVLTITNQNKMNMHSHNTSVQPRVLSLSIPDAAAVSSSLLQQDIF